MSHAVHIFISYDAADTRSALDLQRQIGLALQPRDTVFWNRELVPPEAFRAQALAFLEHTDLFVAILSMNYEDTPDVRWEMSTVLDLQDNRPNLQVMTVLARESVAPTLLRTCQTALPTPESIEKLPAYRDQQLRRAAESAVAILEAAPLANRIPIGDIVLPFSIEALRERLLAQTDRINHTPLLSLLKRIIKDVPVKRAILDIEDAYRQLREQTRLSQVTIQALQQQSKPILQDLQYLLERLEEPQLVPAWRSVFIRDYYHFTPESRDESSVPPFFVPTDEIYIPESLHRQRNEYDQPAGMWNFANDRAAPLWPVAQPMGHDAHARRLVGRLSGRCCFRDGSVCSRQRRWRINTDPGGMLWARWPEAAAWPDLVRSRRRRLIPRHRWRTDAHNC